MGLCTYVVRFINPQRKSDYKVLKWHNMHERFATPRAVKEKLRESFREHVPEALNFEIGYFEKPGSSKRWIETPEDLDAMYKTYHNEAIPLWCDARSEGNTDNVPKRKAGSESNDAPQNKRSKREDEIESTFHTLRTKHSDQYSDPKLRLWARMYVNGLHDDLESPPNVPAITGEPVKRKREDHNHYFTEALAGAATAITKVLAGSQRPSTPPSCSIKPPTGISPASKANLSSQYLEQIRLLQQLRENGALSEEEFGQQKHMILRNLSGLNN